MYLTPDGRWDWAAYYAATGIAPPAPRTAEELEAERLASDAALADRLGRRWGMEPAKALARYERMRERYWAAE